MSMWLGLGGWQGWSNSMPHMGSEHGWNEKGEKIQRLWCQWWQGRDDQSGWISWIVTGLDLNEGDEIVCHLAVTDANSVECYFLNQTTGTLAGVMGRSTRPVVGSSSEWVVEQPVRFDYDDGQNLQQIGWYPLASLDPVSLRICASRLGDVAEFRRRTLADADLIEMVGHTPGGEGTVSPLQAQIERPYREPVLTVSSDSWLAPAKRRRP
jgi:hypothetical protein